MNRAEIETAANLLRRFAVEHAEMLSPVAVNHVGAVVVLLDVLGHLVPDPLPRPSDRVGGMCPCEIADLAKAVQS